jgi:hypothetical protein
VSRSLARRSDLGLGRRPVAETELHQGMHAAYEPITLGRPDPGRMQAPLDHRVSRRRGSGGVGRSALEEELRRPKQHVAEDAVAGVQVDPEGEGTESPEDVGHASKRVTRAAKRLRGMVPGAGASLFRYSAWNGPFTPMQLRGKIVG